eukprot:Lithocolla_globosa_v1_NODE_366_length_4288_cov_54.588944.p2 type:complete len:225 gc:universal NODE_366_length_4288_cov_54.588944:3742-3068(-)
MSQQQRKLDLAREDAREKLASMQEKQARQQLAAGLAGPRPVRQVVANRQLYDVGTGYSCNKTFHRHADKVIDLIGHLAKNEPLKQFELAREVFACMSGSTSAVTTSEEKAKDDIMESLKVFHQTLIDLYPGRFPNEVRAAVQAVSTAVSLTGSSSVAARARVLRFNPAILRDSKKRWELFLDNNTDSFIELRGRVRSDKTPDAWLEFLVEDVWLGQTRESEKAS